MRRVASAHAASRSLTEVAHGEPPQLCSRRVALADGVAPATLTIEGGRIVTVGPYDPGAGSVDLGDLVVLPGLVDTHVHINEPGRTDWEGFETASRAAASGGVTTLVDMPLNSDPVTVTAPALEAKRRAAAKACTVDYGFWAGLVPTNLSEIEAVWEAGALGFKAFLVDSGIPEFGPIDRAFLTKAMPRLAALGAPLLVHAEAPDIVAAAVRAVRDRLGRGGDTNEYRPWVESRPPEAEAAAIDLIAELSLSSGCRVHIVHLAGASALARVRAAKIAGAPLTAETCPHYLTFDANEIPDGAVEYKCAPPIRAEEDMRALWEGLADGSIDLIATDHSPSPAALKSGRGFFSAWGGIASLGLALSVVWTEGRGRGVVFEDLSRWLSAGPAVLAGLDASKGSLRVGADADLAIFDPDTEFVLGGEHIAFRNPVTPYLGRKMFGMVKATLSRGRLVYAHPSFDKAASFGDGASGMGTWLR